MISKNFASSLQNSRFIHGRSLAFIGMILNSLAFLSLLASEGDSKEKRPPNIIFLLVDDWGWKDAECLGSDFYKTPNLNKFSQESMRFVHGYSACTVCSPTRAAILTGHSPGRLHLTDFIAGHVRPKAKLKVPDWTMKIPHEKTTLAEALKVNGYRTAHVGKWHLMPRGQPDMEDHFPESHGFDINIAGNEWGLPPSYFYPYARRNRMVYPLLNTGKEGEYLTDRLTDEALKIIDQWEDNPFFLYFSYYTVHTPIQGKPEYVAESKKRLKPGLQHNNPTYAAMVQSLDDSIGRLMRHLEEKNLEDRTIIFLTGDNGGLDRRNGPTDNSPLREGKGHVYEGGVRVPTWIKWPGIVAPRNPMPSTCYFHGLLSNNFGNGRNRRGFKS